jgi:superfamily II DNA or RNA helicase
MSSLFPDIVPPVAQPVKNVVARPYQLDAIKAAFNEWETVASTLIVMPTGTGKSVVFAKILKQWLAGSHCGRVMIMAHRKELIAQAREHAMTAGATCEIEMADKYAGKKSDVVVASVQTLNAGRKCFDCEGVNSGDCHTCGGSGRVKRMTRFDPRDFGLIITDEGHHGTAASYMDVYTWFGSNPENKRLFVTATPERADEQGLHNVCESVAYRMELQTAIADGWLCPIRQKFVEVEGLDLSRVSTRQGDLADGELERAFIGDEDADQEERLHAIVKPVLETAKGQQFIVFAAGVKHAELLQAAFNAYDDSKVETLLGTTDPAERQKIVQRLKNGKTRGLVNVGVCTEGFDCPAVAVVAIARPTKSTPLYLQMIGRGTRPLPGLVDIVRNPMPVEGPELAAERRAAIAASDKQHCIVMDFVGNSGSHKLVSVADVLAGKDADRRDIDEAIRLTRADAEHEDMLEAIEKAKKSREAKEKRQEEERLKRISTRKKADAVRMTLTDVDLFDGNSFNAERDYQPPNANAASVNQVAYLVKLGVDPEKATTVTRSQAGAMITSQKNKRGGDFVVTFGKYKGNPIRKMPRGYLSWMTKNIDSPDIQRHIREFKAEQ